MIGLISCNISVLPVPPDTNNGTQDCYNDQQDNYISNINTCNIPAIMFHFLAKT